MIHWQIMKCRFDQDMGQSWKLCLTLKRERSYSCVSGMSECRKPDFLISWRAYRSEQVKEGRGGNRWRVAEDETAMAVMNRGRQENSNEPSFVTLFSVPIVGCGSQLKGGGDSCERDCKAISPWRHVAVLGRRRSNSALLALFLSACLFCLCISTRFSLPTSPSTIFFYFFSLSAACFFLSTLTLSFFYVVVTFADRFYH